MSKRACRKTWLTNYILIKKQNMKYILGQKLHMTQLFAENGTVIPVTAVTATPNTVVGIRSKDKDGYEAVVLASGEQKPERATKATLGGFNGKAYKTVSEVRLAEASGLNVGDLIAVDTFAAGDNVTVTGISKAKGFQGVVKRHGFHGGPRSHGQKHSEREPGSIGGGPGRAGGRVVRGMRMAGRTGGDTVTVKGLKIAGVDAEQNILYIRGAIPGRRGTVIKIVG
jgi:large subunit ribosomal protein L3